MNKELAKAWENFILAAPRLKNSDGFRFDIVDVTRQVLSNHAISIHKQFTDAFDKKDIVAFQKYASDFLQLIDDLDELVGTRKDFLLGNWIEDARKWGVTPDEKDLYERNARNIITTWGDKNNRLHEYSARQWNGLFKNFYKPRWQQFFIDAEKSILNNQKFDQGAFVTKIRDWEWNWVKGKEKYKTQAVGNEVETCLKMFKKYYHKVMMGVEPEKQPSTQLSNIP